MSAFALLVSRYRRTLLRDRRTVLLLIAQAPVIGALIGVVYTSGALGAGASAGNAFELLFLVVTGSIWLGVASSSREVVKERGLVEREFDVGVRLDSYVLSKATVLFGLVAVEVVLLVGVVVLLQPLYVSGGQYLDVFVLAILTGWASVGVGLMVSCAARTTDQAAGAIPLVLMPQLLLAGAVVPLASMPALVRALATVTYARWAYAGVGSAGNLALRLSGSGASALGYDPSSFGVAPAAAAAILFVFIFVELFLASVLLTRRWLLER